MDFVLAFVIGGCMCLLFQVVMMVTKLHPPEMLIIGFALGAVLVPTGVVGWLEAVGGAGMGIMIMDAGAATFGGLLSLFHGDPSVILLVLGIFVLVALLGCIAGALFMTMHKADGAAEEQPAA